MDVDLDRVWTRVAGRVWATGPSRTERLARRLLRSPGLAKALVVTPSLLRSWLVATVVVLTVGVVASRPAGTALVPLLAPALAGAGIAYAYGPGTDPAYELGLTMPVTARMVLLVRSLAVFAVNAGLGVAASVLTPLATGLTLSWLVPMTAVTALALATATVAGSANVGMTAGLGGWCLVVLAGQVATGRIDAAASAPVLMPLYLLSVVLCIAVVLLVTRTPAGKKRGWS
ncbi:hypothetical protein [Amycolatopsis sp. CA-126428]|uniref:hypothetical protein n=1 Tax=Amycolatopsis sp. CA-126428 TaxID=2073158 RepID=UPI000CD1CCD5|nr:hypothetical protein [Amycolatopsis sp. CA-126428]